MKNFKRLGAIALVTAAMTAPALAQSQPTSFENSTVIAIITGVAVSIVAIGGASFSIHGLIFAYKTIKSMLRGG